MNGKKRILLFVIVALVIGLLYGWVGNPIVALHNRQLSNSITSITNEQVVLNDIVPFEWDTVYTFDPYTSKDQIEQIVGFESASIRANNINEGMVHLLFVKKRKVVSSVLGYPQSLGYRLDFNEKVSATDHAIFDVSSIDGIVMLSQVKDA